MRCDNRKMKKSIQLLSSRLEERQSDIDLPLCVSCPTQTSYGGDDLDCGASDAAYRCPMPRSMPCLDPRQYIGIQGQKWTTLRALVESDTYHNDFHELVAAAAWTFKTRPAFGIGQRAFLLKTAGDDGGLIMWDCVAYPDDATMQAIDRIPSPTWSSVIHTTTTPPRPPGCLSPNNALAGAGGFCGMVQETQPGTKLVSDQAHRSRAGADRCGQCKNNPPPRSLSWFASAALEGRAVCRHDLGRPQRSV